MPANRDPILGDLLASFNTPIRRRRFKLRLAAAICTSLVLVVCPFVAYCIFLGLLLFTLGLLLCLLLTLSFLSNPYLGFALAAGSAIAIAAAVRFRPQAIGIPSVPSEIDAPAIPLTREEQPSLYAAVDRLCQSLHAPSPALIEVNVEPGAEVRFHEDWLKHPLGPEQFTLRIGLPLAAGLDLEEFVGVLAHECGHLAQRQARRATRLVLGFELNWQCWTRTTFGYNPIAHVMAKVSNLCRCLLIQSAEYDADQYFALLVGGRVFSKASIKIQLLNVAWMLWKDSPMRLGSLAGNLPESIVDAVNRNRGALERARAEVFESSTKWFDEGPSERDRLAAVARTDSPGTFHSTAPANILFCDFPRLCETATAAYYDPFSVPELVTNGELT